MPAAAQDNLPRIKGRIVDFDGLTFHLAPETGPQLAIRLQARTQFMTTQKLALADIKVGSYAGATVVLKDGVLTAEEVHLYPDAMRGSSEGRIALGNDRFVITGAVTAASAEGLTLFYRGGHAAGGICLGRAGPVTSQPGLHRRPEGPRSRLCPRHRPGCRPTGGCWWRAPSPPSPSRPTPRAGVPRPG